MYYMITSLDLGNLSLLQAIITLVDDGTNSQIHEIKCGVPQGFFPGLLLLILYMNDICNVSKLLFTILYADNTCVLLDSKNLNDLIIMLNAELESLFIWLNPISFHCTLRKLFFMVFHRARIKNTNCNDLIIDDTSIASVYSAKYLGIIIDLKLN